MGKKNTLLYFGSTKDQYLKIRDAIDENNRKTIVSWSFIASLFWIMSLAMAFGADAYAKCKLVYHIVLCINLFTLIVARFFVRQGTNRVVLHFLMNLLSLSLICAGVGIAVCQPDVRTVTMIAMAIIIPSIFIQNTLLMVLLELFGIIVYILWGKNIIEASIYKWGLTNMIIFSAAGIMIGHVINRSRFERFFFADSAKELAELQTKFAYCDQMTGLKNRRAYSEMVDSLSNRVLTEFCIVIADLNELKKLNDTYGHEAGDELISAASKCLAEAFGDVDTIYRIGGDEFCVIMQSFGETAEACVAKLKKLTAAYKGRYFDGFTISCGIAYNKNGENVELVVKEADKLMYKDKREYYEHIGVDRRH